MSLKWKMNAQTVGGSHIFRGEECFYRIAGEYKMGTPNVMEEIKSLKELEADGVVGIFAEHPEKLELIPL